MKTKIITQENGDFMKCKPEMLAEPKKIWYDESVS